jgi:hypothetical protein
MRTFEINGHGGFPACSSLQKLSHDRDSMQTAHQTLRQNHDISTSGGQTPAQHYINVVGYLSDDFGTSATSILARGWDVRVMVNIASAASLEPNITTYRALLRNPGFAIDTQTDAGSVHASQMQLVDTDLITVGGNPVFATPADAADVTYYAGDSTHPNVAGCIARVTGGDTPARGIAFGL